MKSRYVIGLVGLTALGVGGLAYATPKAKGMLEDISQKYDSVIVEQDITAKLTPLVDRLTVLEESYGVLDNGISSNQDLIQENSDSYATMAEGYTALTERLDNLEQQINAEQKVYCSNLDLPFVDSELLFCAREETLGEQYSEPKVEAPVVKNE